MPSFRVVFLVVCCAGCATGGGTSDDDDDANPAESSGSGTGQGSGSGSGAASGGMTGSGSGSGSGGTGGATGSGGSTTTGAGGNGGSGVGSGGAGGASMMDPLLDLPSSAGQSCNNIGFGSDCPSLQVCRISGSTSGTCEGCTTCNNLNVACTQSSDCDILFQCYQGKCTNICPLGTFYCGPIEDCIDVGHATHGVCKP